jgi:DNA-binding GntR family transcriptional regulator
MAGFYSAVDKSRVQAICGIEGKDMTYENATPIYLQVRDELAEQIGTGKLHAGERLPSERVMAAKKGAARETIREAFRMLEGEGLIYRNERRGYFVSPRRLRYDPTKHLNAFRLIRKHGGEPSSISFGWAEISASSSLARMMACKVGTPLLFHRTLILIDDRKVCYEENYLLSNAFPGFLNLEFEPPVTDFLISRFGVKTKQIGFRARPTNLYGIASESLGVNAATPGIFFTRIKAQDGKILQVDRDYWLSNILEITVGHFPQKS